MKIESKKDAYLIEQMELMETYLERMQLRYQMIDSKVSPRFHLQEELDDIDQAADRSQIGESEWNELYDLLMEIDECSIDLKELV